MQHLRFHLMNISSLKQRLAGYVLLLPVMLSALLAGASYNTPGVSADGQTYLQIARNLHYGIGLGWQALWAPPFQPVLVSLVSRLPGLGDLQFACGVTTAVMGVLLTAAVCYLATELFGSRVALAAGFITAVFPHFRWISRSTEPEITYTVLLVLSLALLATALRRSSFACAALSGAAFSLAYMSRSEGFMVMLFTLGGVCLAGAVRKHAGIQYRLTAVAILFFFVVSFPYLQFLKNNYGVWTISPKATYVLIWMKSRIYHDNHNGEIDNEDLWGLDNNGKLKWQQPSGFRDLATYLMSHPAKSLQVYLHNLSLELPGRIPNNSGMQHFPQVYPVILALLAIAAAFRRTTGTPAIRKAILFSPLLILLLFPVYTDGWWKYLVPYAPLVIIAACAGLADLLGTVIPVETRANRAFFLAATVLTCWYWYSAIPPRQPAAVSNLDKSRRNYAAEADKAGKWIASTFGPGRNYMVKWNKLIYPLNGLWTAEPVADLPEKLRYAVSQGAEFYLLELPEDLPANALSAPIPGLALQTVYRSPDSGYAVAVFRITGY